MFITFDQEMARVSGLPTGALYILLLSLMALTIVLSIKVVGIILVSALVVIPAAAAYQLTEDFWRAPADAAALQVAIKAALERPLAINHLTAFRKRLAVTDSRCRKRCARGGAAMYRTILVSLDGSALSERALPVATALVTLIAGGLHLAGVAEEDLGRACRRLAAMTAATPPLQRVYPGHCTGEAFLALARALGTMVVCSSPVGTVIPFGE